MTSYRWKQGAQVRVEAQAAGEHLEALREEYGHLTRELVLEEAISASSPLHGAFEWDDAKAGQLYRLDQAGYLIRSIVIVSDDLPDREVRAFVHVIDQDTKPVYQALVVALSDEDMRQQVLAEALREIKSWQAKYRDYKELARIHAAIEEVEVELTPTPA